MDIGRWKSCGWKLKRFGCVEGAENLCYNTPKNRIREFLQSGGMAMISKSQMTEEDIKLNYITPAIQTKGWTSYITMETKITDGKVNLRGNLVVRETPKRVDYLLYIRTNHPIAVVEAKDNNHSISFGLQQAKEYAKKLDLPFAYSSNGDGFEE